MNTIARERAGAVKAGANVGGQFATLNRPEPMLPAGFTSTGPEAEVLEALSFEHPGQFICSMDREQLILMTVQGEHRQDVSALAALDADERKIGYRAIGDYLVDRSELHRLEGTQDRQFDPHVKALLDEDIATLTSRVQLFEQTSRWSEDNLLMVNKNHSEEWGASGASEKYQVFVRRTGDSIAVTQSMTAELQGISMETAREYRPEISEWLSAHFEGEVTLGLNGEKPAFKVERRFTLNGECINAAELHENAGEAEPGTLHSMGTGSSSHDPKLLLGYLQTHEAVNQQAFIAIRTDWTESTDPVGDMRRVGVQNMKPEHWASAFERARSEPSPPLNTGTQLRDHRLGMKLVTDFAHRGKISNRPVLAAEIRRQGQMAGASPALREISEALAARLEAGPLNERPAPTAS